MRQGKNSKETPTKEQVAKVVRIFGGVTIVLCVYMLLGAILVAAKAGRLPLSSPVMAARTLGLIAAVIVWGSGILAGLGLLLISAWGRRIAILWGKAIVWILPIGFGLAAGGMKNFFSVQFLVIIVICICAVVMAGNLARDEFDIGFER